MFQFKLAYNLTVNVNIKPTEFFAWAIKIIYCRTLLLQPIQDSDPFINCDLMDGRDAFLTMARERHYEFSSLRRAKFSSMSMLYELHNQGQDRFVYTCNNCKGHVETRYHCTICDVSFGCTIF